MIEFFCASCGEKIYAADEDRGAEQRCPNRDCGRTVRVPGEPVVRRNKPEPESTPDLFSTADESGASVEIVTSSENPRVTRNRPGRAVSPEKLAGQRSNHLFWTLEGVFLLSTISTVALTDRELFHAGLENHLGTLIGRFLGLIVCYTLLLIQQGFLLKLSCWLHNWLFEESHRVGLPALETTMLVGFLAASTLSMIAYLIDFASFSMVAQIVTGIVSWVVVWSGWIALFLTTPDHRRAPVATSLRVAGVAQLLNLILFGLGLSGFVLGRNVGWW